MELLTAPKSGEVGIVGYGQGGPVLTAPAGGVDASVVLHVGYVWNLPNVRSYSGPYVSVGADVRNWGVSYFQAPKPNLPGRGGPLHPLLGRTQRGWTVGGTMIPASIVGALEKLTRQYSGVSLYGLLSNYHEPRVTNVDDPHEMYRLLVGASCLAGMALGVSGGGGRDGARAGALVGLLSGVSYAAAGVPAEGYLRQARERRTW
ncbi:MAG: hypothetical protein PVH68_03265 [Armatimonadota bacterium]